MQSRREFYRKIRVVAVEFWQVYSWPVIEELGDRNSERL